MKELHIDSIIQTTAHLCIQANLHLNKDVVDALQSAQKKETLEVAKNIITLMLENATIAKEKSMPICQDTGMAVIFIELGQDLHIVGGDLSQAINQGVALGYEKGYLRKSVVADPIDRVNTNDNTPAVIHYNIVPGENLKITVAPKGFGSENKSTLKMLKPSDGLEGIKKFVIDSVLFAGSNPCPPIIVGIGIGGTMEKAALLSKEALVRDIGSKNPTPFWASLEDEFMDIINQQNIGPAGFGGLTSAIGVHIATYPTHIAGLPVAVNIGCHVNRHTTSVL